MRRRADTHKPGTVSKIIKPPTVKTEQAEISLEGADPVHAKIRIVIFLLDEMGRGTRLEEGDGVDVAIRSDEIEPDAVGASLIQRAARGVEGTALRGIPSCRKDSLGAAKRKLAGRRICCQGPWKEADDAPPNPTTRGDRF
jgi:hypothetical protein